MTLPRALSRAAIVAPYARELRDVRVFAKLAPKTPPAPVMPRQPGVPRWC